MIGLGAFALFSLACGLATSSGMLIAFRALQGMAGAILSPSVFSIVSVTFREGSERNKALGILGAIAGSGAAIGVSPEASSPSTPAGNGSSTSTSRSASQPWRSSLATFQKAMQKA